MAKRRKDDVTRTQPLSLEALHEYGALKELDIPAGPFDAGGQWQHTYQIWLVGTAGRRLAGFLRVERQDTADRKSIALHVETLVMEAARTVHVTKARLTCFEDALTTPFGWELDSVVLDAGGKSIDDTRLVEKARVSGGKIELAAGGRTLTREVPPRFTSNWSLFDAIQRLPGRKTEPLEFALLEDLDLLKKGQKLSYWKTAEAQIGGKPIRLIGYQQIGRGILPYQYWVDDQHRLLIAISGVRAYLFDNSAQERIEKRVKALRRQGRRG